MGPDEHAKEHERPFDPAKDIFVFGSNEEGRHYAGAAKYATDYCGAESGVGVGPTVVPMPFQRCMGFHVCGTKSSA
jgi:hypothetical protein